MLGLLIISILHGLFKAGHVKVRGLAINHTDSPFPSVELVAALVSDPSSTVDLPYFYRLKMTRSGVPCVV